jgi:hypothetical protein
MGPTKMHLLGDDHDEHIQVTTFFGIEEYHAKDH